MADYLCIDETPEDFKPPKFFKTNAELKEHLKANPEDDGMYETLDDVITVGVPGQESQTYEERAEILKRRKFFYSKEELEAYKNSEEFQETDRLLYLGEPDERIYLVRLFRLDC